MASAHDFFVREQIRQHLSDVRQAVGGLQDSAGRYGLNLPQDVRSDVAAACGQLEQLGEQLAELFGEDFPSE